MLLMLASEGHRIPVEMTELKLLKFELEAREWSLETKKMLTLGNKKFKSEDVCAHLEKGASLQNKFPLTDDDDNISTLRYKEDLKQLIQKANIWLDKYKQSFGDDNAQSSASDSKPHISIQLITDLINQSNQMPIHLGPPLSKLSSISSKIDSWLHNHSSVLSHCQNPIQNYHKSNPPNPCQIQSALAEAPTHLPVTLTEITHLKSLLETAQKLSEWALLLAPVRQKSKCRNKDTKTKFSIQQLIQLAQQLASSPVDLSDDKIRIQEHLSDVAAWRLDAQCRMTEIASAFALHKEEWKGFIYMKIQNDFLFKKFNEKTFFRWVMLL